jgi:predicted DNA-binding transcriptional regulator AlpA
MNDIKTAKQCHRKRTRGNGVPNDIEDTEEQNVLLTESDAARYLKVTTRALQKWRYSGGGPKFVRISSRCIRYRMQDIESWLSGKLASSTSTI